MVTVGCLVDTVKTFVVIGKHESKSMGGSIRNIIDIDQENQGAQNIFLECSRQDRKEAGNKSVDRDTLTSVTPVRLKSMPKTAMNPQSP